MFLMRWEKLPSFLQKDAVKPYYAVLRKRWLSLLFKRCLDLFLSSVLLLLFFPLMFLLALLIKSDTPGPVFFRQLRVTRYGRAFRIVKFRTMRTGAECQGAAVTQSEDRRITAVGRRLRHYRLDELPQLLNIFLGEMSFVGTRPEVPKYVAAYNEEMWATLLLPAGLTSMASIEFRNESDYLPQGCDVDKVYSEVILPQKMRYNLEYLRSFSFFGDLRLMIKTVCLFLKK